MKLTEKQASFIETEFGYHFSHGEDIEIPREAMEDIHDKSFDIEAEELPGKNDEPWSERCTLAVTICNMMYEELSKIAVEENR